MIHCIFCSGIYNVLYGVVWCTQCGCHMYRMVLCDMDCYRDAHNGIVWPSLIGYFMIQGNSRIHIMVQTSFVRRKARCEWTVKNCLAYGLNQSVAVRGMARGQFRATTHHRITKALSSIYWNVVSFLSGFWNVCVLSVSYQQARKLGRCDSYLRNLKLAITHCTMLL